VPPIPPRPFSIDVPDAVLDDLRDRLARVRWPEPVRGAGWDYGADVAYLSKLCAYWRDGYDWRHWEARLNEPPGFLCEVDGVGLHFWHVRGAGRAPMPLLLLHGWPGSMVEFLELVGPLTDPGQHGEAADAFDVVVPSLPGFGFGGAPRERGWGVSRIAAAFDALMTRELGYERYGVQGGDWGGLIAAKLGPAAPSA
jgi:microsomal epoxide hydrolase